MTTKLTYDQQVHLESLVEELRTGNRSQTPGVLCRITSEDADHPAGQCCLGVAADISGKGFWKLPTTKHSAAYFVLNGSDTHDYGDDAVLPVALQEHYGFQGSDGPFFPSQATMDQIEALRPWLVGNHRDSLDPNPATHHRHNGKVMWTLVSLNDAGVPFKVIGDIIERDILEPGRREEGE